MFLPLQHCNSPDGNGITHKSQCNLTTTEGIAMYLAINVGGTKIRVAAFESPSPEPESKRKWPQYHRQIKFELTGDFERDMALIFKASDEIVPSKDVRAVGMVVAGRVNELNTREIVRSGNLENWHGRDLGGELFKHYHAPFTIMNDAQGEALGEAVYGITPTVPFNFITWGGGLGGAVVRRIGTPIRPESFATELGHQRVDSGKVTSLEICSCGQEGCLEAYVGGIGIQRYFKTPAQDLNSNQWLKVLQLLADGLRNFLAIQPTKLVVFGGGIACKQQEMHSRLDSLHSLLAPQLKIVPIPQFRVADLGEDAGIYGALAAATGWRR